MNIQLSQAEQDLLARIEKAGGQTSAGVLKDTRDAAIQLFQERGLPTRRVEEWKYTDLKARLKEIYSTAEKGNLTEDELQSLLGGQLNEIDAWRIVLVDGFFDPSLSNLDDLPGGVELLSLAEINQSDVGWTKELFGHFNKSSNEIDNLNFALAGEGIVLRLADKLHLSKPIVLLHVSTGSDKQWESVRHMISVGKEAAGVIFEIHTGLDKAAVQKNISVNLLIDEGAEIDHIKLALDETENTHLASFEAALYKDVNYKLIHFTQDGGLSRNQGLINFLGEDAEFSFAGTAILKGKAHADTTLVMDHKVPNCESRELYKTVLDDQSRAVFQGKVIVAPHAQKTDGEMMSRALLLSDGCEFDSKPELEIYADDVLCGHGSTTGQIDEDLLYYLKARGIGDKEARGLLIQAFIGEVLEEIDHDEVRDWFVALAEHWHRQ